MVLPVIYLSKRILDNKEYKKLMSLSPFGFRISNVPKTDDFASHKSIRPTPAPSFTIDIYGASSRKKSTYRKKPVAPYILKSPLSLGNEFAEIFEDFFSHTSLNLFSSQSGKLSPFSSLNLTS